MQALVEEVFTKLFVHTFIAPNAEQPSVAEGACLCLVLSLAAAHNAGGLGGTE